MSRSRVVGITGARRRWGSRADRVASAYGVADPLADEAVRSMAHDLEAGRRALRVGLEGGAVHGPPALRRLVERAHEPRPWLDAERCDRGATVLRRWAPWVALVLRCDALPRAYASPVGNKPLARTGRMVEDARRRLVHTARFIWDTQQPGAMLPGGVGVRACAMVRWTHAVVRHGLQRQGWDPAWGAPLPQADLAATGLLFGVVAVDALRRLGAEIDEDQADAIAHLYRAVADHVGVVPALQTDTHADGLDHFALLTAMHGEPDADSRRLTAALLSTSLRRRDDDEHPSAIDRAIEWGLRGIAGHLLGELGPQLGLHPGRRRAAAARWLLRAVPLPLPAQPALVHWLLR